MMNDTDHEQPTSSNIEYKKKPVIEKIFNGPDSYKVGISLVVTGIVVASVLWLFTGSQAGNPNSTSLMLPPENKAHEKEKANRLKDLKDEHEAISRVLDSISSRINERESSRIESSGNFKSELQGMAESIRDIKEVVAGLGVDQKDLLQQISKSSKGLNAIANDVQALKVAKHKSKARENPRPVKKPSFDIDAIDVWDDVSYVAISQSGQVSFLKVGDQQSGWTLKDIDHLNGQVSFQGAAGNIYSTTIQR